MKKKYPKKQKKWKILKINLDKILEVIDFKDIIEEPEDSNLIKNNNKLWRKYWRNT